MKHHIEKANQATTFGPVRKLRWLVGAASRTELSRAELAMLIILADHTNTNTGKAWPAFPRLAQHGGVTTRTAKRAVARLTTLDLVVISEHGGPGRSNRYRLNWDIFEQSGDSVDDDTIQTGTVTATAASGDTGDPKMVTPLSPNPINRSEQEAKEKIEGSQAECEAAPPRLGACGLPHIKGYECFWDAWGRKVTVAETERLIDAKVEDGHTLDDIVAGVQRFQKYCADTGKPSRIKPAAFVHGEKWRDDWQLYPAEPAKPKRAGKGSNSGKPTKAEKATRVKRVKNPWQYNPAWDSWHEKWMKQIQFFLKRHAHEFPNGSIRNETDATRMNELLRPWKLENLEPPYYKNTQTGKTWGTQRDKCPAPDWTPNKQGSG
jgi:hypothetical protein